MMDSQSFTRRFNPFQKKQISSTQKVTFLATIYTLLCLVPYASASEKSFNCLGLRYKAYSLLPRTTTQGDYEEILPGIFKVRAETANKFIVSEKNRYAILKPKKGLCMVCRSRRLSLSDVWRSDAEKRMLEKNCQECKQWMIYFCSRTMDSDVSGGWKYRMRSSISITKETTMHVINTGSETNKSFWSVIQTGDTRVLFRKSGRGRFSLFRSLNTKKHTKKADAEKDSVHLAEMLWGINDAVDRYGGDRHFNRSTYKVPVPKFVGESQYQSSWKKYSGLLSDEL